MRVLSSSLYKDTTFSREILIPLTFRNNPPNVKKTRFAAASLHHVLYYEAGSGERQMGRRQMVECHGFGNYSGGLSMTSFFNTNLSNLSNFAERLPEGTIRFVLARILRMIRMQ